jgi:hypothetical protein
MAQVEIANAGFGGLNVAFQMQCSSENLCMRMEAKYRMGIIENERKALPSIMHMPLVK